MGIFFNCLLFQALLCLLLGIATAQTTNKWIKCGETKTGETSKGQTIKFIFKATSSRYTDVTLNACSSSFDTILTLKNNKRKQLAFEDDSDVCIRINEYASAVSIPANELGNANGKKYFFYLQGYDDWQYGEYEVKLVCESNDGPGPAPVEPSPPPAPVSPVNEECPRTRQAWHLMNEDERSLYIDGFKQIAERGILKQFVIVHGVSAEHRNSAFLPWHRYFLWELETQIRNLGGRFVCFSLPYWDWTSEVDRYEYNIGNWEILNSGLGSLRDGSSVVRGNNFGNGNYDPYNGNYLQRKICTDGAGCSWTGSTASQLMNKITQEINYYDNNRRTSQVGYGQSLESDGHDYAHVRIGGGGHLGSTGKACDDPIFWMLHCFVDYQYTLWQDCYNHEQVNSQSITSQMYDGEYNANYEMDFGRLEDNQYVASWNKKPFCLNNDIRIRDMHSNQDWNIKYDRGDFFARARVEDNRVCRGNINSDLFTQTNRRRLAEYERKNRKRSQYSGYSEDLFDKLDVKVGSNQKSTEQNVDLFKSWAQMDCEYLTMENRCERPKYFDDCSDMEIVEQERNYGRFYDDIDITLDELKEKVGNVQCMIDTREQFYSWAYETGNLLGLCRGDYDRFCDREFKNEEPAQDQCLARADRKQKRDKDRNERRKRERPEKNRQNGGGPGYRPGGGRGRGGRGRERERRNGGDNGGDNGRRGTRGGNRGYAGMSDYLSHQIENDTNPSDKFSQFEEILLSAVLNGLIISIVLLIFMCCYYFVNRFNAIANNKAREPQQNEQLHKYDAVDIEE